jgi:hypothetical protein
MNRAAAIGNPAGMLFQSLLPHKKTCGFVRNTCSAMAAPSDEGHSGAALRAEPGIHRGIEVADEPWIPASGFAGPGMTMTECRGRPEYPNARLSS